MSSSVDTPGDDTPVDNTSVDGASVDTSETSIQNTTPGDRESKASSAFTDTETFTVYLLHNTMEHIEKNGVEKIFVDNCSTFGVTYFLYVFTTLYNDNEVVQSLKEELVRIVDEERLDTFYRYFKTYTVEYYVRDTQFGHSNAIYDIVRHCQINKSIGILEYLYQQCSTSAETDTLLRKLYEGISPENLTQFEMCDLYSLMCTWKRFRNYLTSHTRWCMKTLQQNERSILHRVFHITYTRKTFSDIHSHLGTLTDILFKHATIPYLTWMKTILRQNKFRRHDKWIIGLRTQEPVTSMREHVLMNVFACLQNHRSISPEYSISEFVDAYQGEIPVQDSPTDTYLLFLQCQAFNIIVHPLFKKLDYVAEQHAEINTIIEMATMEYTTNENASLATISASLTEMFRNKLSYLATSLDLTHILIPSVLDIIHKHGYDVLQWFNEGVESIFFRTNHHTFLTNVQNILFAFNYSTKKLKYNYPVPDGIKKTVTSLCIRILAKSAFPVHYKSNILEYLQLHKCMKVMTSKQAGDLWTYYSNLDRVGGYSDEITQQQNAVIALMRQYVLFANPMKKERLFDVKDPSGLVFAIVHNITVRMESYRDNYEYARQTYYSDRVLSMREIMSQEKYSKRIQTDITKTLELLKILNTSCRFYRFRETLLEKLNTEKLCEILLYIVRYSTTRYHRTCPIMCKAVQLILYLVTFTTFAKTFVKVCNTTEPQEFKMLQNVIREADMKRHIVGDEVGQSIHKILLTLQHYKGVLIDYDNIDIPFELLDPLMHTLIETPYVIPETNTIMEKSVIVRYLKTKEQNPFTRSKLTLHDLDEYNETESAKKLRYQFETRLQDFYAEHTKEVQPQTEDTEQLDAENETKSAEMEPDIESKTAQGPETKIETKSTDGETKSESKTPEVPETKSESKTPEVLETKEATLETENEKSQGNNTDVSTEVSEDDSESSTDIGDSDTTQTRAERCASYIVTDLPILTTDSDTDVE